LKVALYVVTGILAGVISGMGIGGGAILIPALTFVFKFNQQAAQSVNLIYFIPTAAVALIAHIKNKKIEKKALWKIIILGLAGAVLGALLALAVDSSLLRRLFGGFLLLMGAVEFFKKKK